MLLVAYAKREGSSYLSQALTQPLNASFSLLSQCEVDIQKIKPTEDENVDVLINQGRLNLEQVCGRVFGHVFVTRRRLPKEVLELCRFLSDTIESVLTTDEAGGSMIMTDTQSAANLAAATHDDKPRRFSFMGRRKNDPGSSNSSMSNTGSLVADLVAGNLFLELGRTSTCNKGDVTDATSSLDSNIPNLTMTIPIGLTTGSNATSPTATMKPSGLRNAVVFESEESVVEKAVAKDSPSRRKASKGNLGNLSMSEKIIGSFLFLRFIVPGTVQSNRRDHFSRIERNHTRENNAPSQKRACTMWENVHITM